MTKDTSNRHKTTLFAPVRAITAIAREFDKVARDEDVSIVQYRLLLFLEDGPRRAGEIAATNLVTKATISGHLATLRQRGWISVELEPFDRRVTRIVLTDTGREAMEKLEAKLLECLRGLIEEKDRERILHGMSEVYWALSASRESRFRDLESPDYQFLPPSGGQ